jgi:hypothetical protein
MDNVEVLVHIAAPSGFHDDKRYRALADAVVRFEAAAVTSVYSRSNEMEQVAEESGGEETTASFATALGGQVDIVKETPIQPRYQRLLSQVGGLPASRAPESASIGRWRITKGPTDSKQNRHFVPNPPYKNPFHNRRLEQPTIQAVRTPDPPRPKTAPAGGTSAPAANPFAGWATRKRAHSESSSFESISSVVPETQQIHNAPTIVNSSGPSTHYLSSSDPGGEQASAVMAQNQEAGDDEGPAQKRPRLDDAQILEEDAITHPPAAPEDRPQPYFLRDRSLDWTSSPAPSSSDAIETSITPTATATPSQTLPEMPHKSPYLKTPKAKEVYLYHNPTSPINLISQDLYSTPPKRPTPLSSPQVPPFSPPVLTFMPDSSISALPAQIFPPPPKTGHGAFSTHITPVLAVTVNRLPIAKCFRPVHVTRDVRVLERGHWRIPITIASQAIVDAARIEIPREQKLAKATKERDELRSMDLWEKRSVLEEAKAKRRRMGLSSSPLQYGEDGQFVERNRQDFWTEEEFVRFWKTLEECIEDGKWGWGIRVYRKELTEDGDDETGKQCDGLQSSPAAGEAIAGEEKERCVLLKVTTWGEVIPHIWILLWLMSDKLTAYIPMEWRAGDDSVVVQMSGYRRKHGVLAEWVCKGPAGEKGIWGIAEAEAPRDGDASNV